MKLLPLLFLIFACAGKGPDSGSTPLASGKKFNAGFLIVDGVYNTELIAPYDIFQHSIFHTDGGINVFTVSGSIDTITTFEGLRILPDFDFQNVPAIDILVVPSAEHSMDSDLEDVEMINFVRRVGRNAKYTISLCDGAFVLAKAGIIDNRESTTFPADIDRYRQMFPHLTIHEGISFVHDGSLLTSQGGIKSFDVAMYLIDLLYGREVARKIGMGLVIDWDPKNYKYIIVEN